MLVPVRVRARLVDTQSIRKCFQLLIVCVHDGKTPTMQTSVSLETWWYVPLNAESELCGTSSLPLLAESQLLSMYKFLQPGIPMYGLFIHACGHVEN